MDNNSFLSLKEKVGEKVKISKIILIGIIFFIFYWCGKCFLFNL